MKNNNEREKNNNGEILFKRGQTAMNFSNLCYYILSIVPVTWPWPVLLVSR